MHAKTISVFKMRSDVRYCLNPERSLKEREESSLLSDIRKSFSFYGTEELEAAKFPSAYAKSKLTKAGLNFLFLGCEIKCLHNELNVDNAKSRLIILLSNKIKLREEAKALAQRQNLYNHVECFLISIGYTIYGCETRVVRLKVHRIQKLKSAENNDERSQLSLKLPSNLGVLVESDKAIVLYLSVRLKKKKYRTLSLKRLAFFIMRGENSYLFRKFLQDLR